MTGDLFSDLERAETLVEAIDDEVVAKREIKGETQDGITIEGHGCQHGTHRYIVLASEPWDYLTIQAGFDLDQTIAVHKKLRQNPHIDSPEGLEITDEDINQARKLLNRKLSKVDKNKLRSVRLSLIKNLGQDDFITEIDRSEGPYIHGFDVSKRTYHREDHYSISDFHSDVQGVINVSWYTREYLAETYGLSDFVSSRGESSGPPDTPGFQ